LKKGKLLRDKFSGKFIVLDDVQIKKWYYYLLAENKSLNNI